MCRIILQQELLSDYPIKICSQEMEGLTMMEFIENASGLTWLIIIAIGIATIVRIVQLKCQNRSDTSNAINATSRSQQNKSYDQMKIRSNSLSELGPVVYFANNNHGLTDREYCFEYKKSNGTWRAYILRMPSLMGRNPSGLVTHRLFDGDKSYVCWDSPVSSLKDMQTISKVWAECMQEYIATGKSFG